MSDRCHSALRPLAQGLAFLSNLKVSREARARQKQKEMAERENIRMSVMIKEVLEATIKLDKDFPLIWYLYG